MSRKNKNGSRRNESPRTYSRDFLKPTPIERAIQEANSAVSPKAVAVSDRIACDDKCSYEYKQMPAAWLPQLLRLMRVTRVMSESLQLFIRGWRWTYFSAAHLKASGNSRRTLSCRDSQRARRFS